MEDVSKTIVIGIVTGVVTSAILFLLGVIFQKIIVPWYRRLIYSGVDISGSWYWFDKDEDTVKMELKQSAGEIDGVFTYMDSAKKGETKIYKVSGSIKDRFVQLNMTSTDSKRLGVLSYVFEVVGDGNQLCGCSVYYSTSHDQICTDSESFFRTLEQAKNRLNTKEEQCVEKDNNVIHAPSV